MTVDPLRIANHIPERLETRRLLLRPFTLADAPQLHAALAESQAELMAHLWFLPWVAEEQTLASAEARCRRAQAAFLLRTDLAYLAFDIHTQALVGSAGLHRTDWSVPKTEVGYWIRSSMTGRGYASEAVTALTHWALTGLGAARVELVTDADNAASRAVATRCGFALEGVLRNSNRSPDGRLRHACVYARVAGGDAALAEKPGGVDVPRH